jgi:hypothetical protein
LIERGRFGWTMVRSGRVAGADRARWGQWVAKWAARYDPHDPGWAEGRFRAAVALAA